MLKLAFCGNDCNCCPRYIATRSNNEERLREVALLWAEIGWRDVVMPSIEMVCYGCNQANWCRYDIRECALKTQVDNCGECRDYPCEKILKVFEQTDIYSKKCEETLSRKDYECLCKAFFSKKANLAQPSKQHNQGNLAADK
jgi:hypothetical protein